MLTLLWNLSAAARGYFRFYLPTNRAVNGLRSPGGRKWAIPVGLVATPTYLGLLALGSAGAIRPGLAWLNVLVVLFCWNSMKFAWLAVITLPMMLARLARSPRGGSPEWRQLHEGVAEPFGNSRDQRSLARSL